MAQWSVKGFTAAGIHAGLKKNGHRDIGLIVSDRPTHTVGVFTRNQVKAAPVQLDLQRIRNGRGRAVIANSGNANCMTGEQGIQDAKTMSAAVAAALDIPEDEVLVASTGVIGEPLPTDRLTAAVPSLVKALRPDGFLDFAQSIMTTDTIPKTVQRSGRISGQPFQILGIAKGAGMIAPHMATMLCFLNTDIDAPPQILQACLTEAVGRTLNQITIDGDTSTNDSVLLMANGASGISIDTPENTRFFQDVLHEVLEALAQSLVKDGEGANKVVKIKVRHAPSDHDADQIARTIATSPLVKTALFGEDANWGRIAAAAGRAGVAFDPDALDMFFNDVQMVKGGVGCGARAESQATAVMRRQAFAITVDLHQGKGRAAVLTCDFSMDYVRINADYRS